MAHIADETHDAQCDPRESLRWAGIPEEQIDELVGKLQEPPRSVAGRECINVTGTPQSTLLEISCAPSGCQCRCHQPGMKVYHIAPCCSGTPDADGNPSRS